MTFRPWVIRENVEARKGKLHVMIPSGRAQSSMRFYVWNIGLHVLDRIPQAAVEEINR
jgi:hypothetical protein